MPFALAALAQGAQLLPDAVVNGEGLAVHCFLRDGDAVFVYAVAHPLEREAADGFEAAGEVLPLPFVMHPVHVEGEVGAVPVVEVFDFQQVATGF